MTTDAQIRHIYERWHETLMQRDLPGMVALYAEHAVMETPAVLAMFPEREDGILRGRNAIEQLFARNFKALAGEFRDLYRSGLFFANGFSGHGVMHSPATGKILADLILKGETDLIDARLLNVERFAEGREIHETAVL